ncbi:MAG: biopolymer transporter ExbD [Tidjanibacter sp.]|jgi:biopolymer transport protein ExbD|nr:biopolymer transporter ExbD [Tidjanibacter sp.]MBQ2247166.1 biopolymer transporter ExbD [Tidjanibacter sp.]
MAIKRGLKINKESGSSAQTDLMFLLLMFMLMATTLINPNALKLTLPKSSNQLKERPYTTVSVTKDLQFYLDGERVPFSQLEGALAAKMAESDDKTVSLHADEGVPIGEVVKVMNIANNNQYRLILATQPE